jgi:hypothetical protein
MRWLVGVVLLMSGMAAALGQKAPDAAAPPTDDAAEKTELRLSLAVQQSRPLEVGQRVQLALNVAYRAAPPRSRIYVHVIALHGRRWAAPGGATLSADNPTFSFSGFFVDGDHSPFKLDASNYPISVVIRNDYLAKVVGQWAGDPAAAAKMAEGISGNKEGYRLFLAHLASLLRPEGIEAASLAFTVPDYGQYFDGLLIVPLMLTYKDDGSQTVTYAGARSTSIYLPVTPNRPEPAPERAAAPEAIPGSAAITGFVPNNLVLVTGARNTVGVRIAYRDLQPGTALYVLAIPVSGNQYVLGALTSELGGLRRSGSPAFVEPPAAPNRGSATSRNLRVQVMGEEKIEAAFVSVVEKGGDGDAEAQVVITPKPYARRYERVHLVPVLLVPTAEGLRYLIDTRKLTGPKLLVSEG